jgi:hypothetical protein
MTLKYVLSEKEVVGFMLSAGSRGWRSYDVDGRFASCSGSSSNVGVSRATGPARTGRTKRVRPAKHGGTR